MEHASTTSLFNELSHRQLISALNHDCLVTNEDRRMPTVVEDQSLRDLRHRMGFDFHKGKFAYCPSCGTNWSYEKMVEKVIRQFGGVCGMVKEDVDDTYEFPKARIGAHLLQFQMNRVNNPKTDTPTLCINAKYQHHVSCHVRGCFKCTQLGSKHVCGSGASCECRFRLPDVSRPRATVKNIDTHDKKEGVVWYRWDGSFQQQPLLQILSKRLPYDLFQNASCAAIPM